MEFEGIFEKIESKVIKIEMLAKPVPSKRRIEITYNGPVKIKLHLCASGKLIVYMIFHISIYEAYTNVNYIFVI